MASPFKSQVYLSIISPCFGKGKYFSDYSSLINLVDIERKHENGNEHICF